MNSPKTLSVALTLQRNDFRLAVDLQLPGQGITVLFGPSGSGKTTVLRCVAGLEQPEGHVVVDGEVWQDSERGRWTPAWARDVGYVFQEASLFEHLNVRANLRYGLDRVKKAGGQQALADAIDLLGIGHLLNRATQSLSGGERQRVAIARALATQPKVLLLDEPLASLDIARRHEILPWLETLHQALRIPMLYITHTMEELTRLADHVVLMKAGQIELQGAIATVLSNPAFAVAVGGEAGAILSGSVVEHDLTHHLTAIDTKGTYLWVPHQNLPIGSTVRLHIHANNVSLSLSRPAHTSILNNFQGVIESIDADSEAASCLVGLRHQGQRIIARVTVKSVRELSLVVGREVWIQVKSVALSHRQGLLF